MDDFFTGSPTEVVTERILFVGRVQGVGFRYTTREISRRFPVVGTVRNQRDGSVEVIAQGAPSALDGFVEAIQDRFRANIRGCDRTRIESTAVFENFEITR